MTRSRFLDNVISYCLMFSLIVVFLDLIYPTETASSFKNLIPLNHNASANTGDNGNYISNGNMEGDVVAIAPANASAITDGERASISGHLAADWQDWSDWSEIKVHYDIDRNNCRIGGACQRIDVSGIKSGYATYAHKLSLPAGVYQTCLWMRSSGRSNIIISVRNIDDAIDHHDFEQKLSVGRKWKRVDFSGRSPGWENASLTVSVLSGGASIWVDDVRVERRVDWSALFYLLTIITISVILPHLFDFLALRLCPGYRRRGASH